jgi:hypothetical protein
MCLEVGVITDSHNPVLEMTRDKRSRPNCTTCKEICGVLTAMEGRSVGASRVRCRENIQPTFVHVVIRYTELIPRRIVYK